MLGAVVALEKLDPEKILATARLLRARTAERFPDAGLVDVADQLVELASRASATCQDLARPNLRLRIASGAVIAILVIALVAGASVAISSSAAGRLTVAELIQAVEAGANDLVLLGVAIYFFVSFETRFKRGKVVKALHQLRTLAHLIDAHQLTKRPEMVGHQVEPTASSPKRTLSAFELDRYLDYCTEMLALTGKIAALYGDGFSDGEALEAVNEVEELTVGLQSKIWQKLILLQAMAAPTPAIVRPVPTVEHADADTASSLPPDEQPPARAIETTPRPTIEEVPAAAPTEASVMAADGARAGEAPSSAEVEDEGSTATEDSPEVPPPGSGEALAS
jgi:hypothetical protein